MGNEVVKRLSAQRRQARALTRDLRKIKDTGLWRAGVAASGYSINAFDPAPIFVQADISAGLVKGSVPLNVSSRERRAMDLG